MSLDQSLAISKKMPFVKVHQFPHGEHDCHQKYSPQFRKIVQNFIINKQDVIEDALAMRLKDLKDEDIKKADKFGALEENNNQQATCV